MAPNFSDYTLKTATRSWYFLTTSGIFALIAGLFIQIIPIEIYNILISLFMSAFITTGLSGIIFTAKDQKIIRSITFYLCYIVLISIPIFTFFDTNKAITCFIGLISLYCYIKFLNTAFSFREYKLLRYRKIILTVCWAGVLISILFSINSLLEISAAKTMFTICFFLYGLTHILMSLALKNINTLYTHHN
ncbi:hypothetical protein BAS09_06975 [Elizabethkingia ursingii]|jgi:uncharacterized membrane protein HdeD (DUF308 family)|nr:hypothetical protein BAS09_06975 [Elizabethkingia ursingii]